jgi:hypothetical protein
MKNRHDDISIPVALICVVVCWFVIWLLVG